MPAPQAVRACPDHRPHCRRKSKFLSLRDPLLDLCDYKTDLDGQWEGSIFASDGYCYFASSTHSGRTGGMFFRFDPKTEKITVLVPGRTNRGQEPNQSPTTRRATWLKNRMSTRSAAPARSHLLEERARRFNSK